MDVSAYLVTSDFGEFADLPPIFVAATSDAARDRAVAVATFAGYRTVAFMLDEAVHRLQIQPRASAIWVELEEDSEHSLDRLLDQVQAEVASGHCPAIVTSSLPMVDRIMARIDNSSVELLVDPTPADRAAALALAMARHNAAPRLNDISTEPSAVRLRQLSDEVSRIAANLERLSIGPAATGVEKPQPASGEVPHVSLDDVRHIIRARRLRARFFDDDLFADPAWDMLLDLLQAEIAQHRVPVSSLCIAAAVPPTTALRWIKTMTDVGLLKRRADPHDGRRIFIELSPGASEAMRRYFAEVGKPSVV